MIASNRRFVTGLFGKICLGLIAATTTLTLAPKASANPGDLYVSDLATNSIVVYPPDFKLGDTPITFVSGLNQPQGVVLDQNKNVYVADAGSGNIYKYDQNKVQSTFISGLQNPMGLAFDGSDFIVAENGADAVKSFALDGTLRNSLPITGPIDVKSDGVNRYVSNGASVFKILPDGTMTDLDPGDGSRGLALLLLAPPPAPPMYVVFVSTGAGLVKKIPPGGTPTTFATDLSQPTGMDFRPARFNGDSGVGNLYVADPLGGNIFQITPQGDKTTFANTGKPNFVVFETGVLLPPVITSATSVTTVIGQPFSYQITATNSPTSYDATGLPTGLTIDTTSGLISGTPTVVGSFSIMLQASNSAGSGNATLALEITAMASGAPIVTSEAATAMEGQAFTYQIIATNSPTSFDATGLPAGLTVDTTTGLITGTPSVSGSFQINLSATNASGTGTGVLMLTVNPVATPSPTPGLFRNISTRDDVLTGDNVLIGGFIITGGVTPKTVVIRGIGPSLANADPPVPGTLADPVLTLTLPDGSTVTNDNWRDNSPADQTIINNSGLAPGSDSEAVIVATLAPVDPSVSAGYTAKVSGANNGTGVALMEVYDLDDPLTATSQLANISTRGFVGTDDNVMIGGFISGPGTNDGKVLLRGIGPSLTDADVPGALADPTLELFDGNGDSISFNDNWQDTAGDEILATGLAPTQDAESAILTTQVAGNYTFIMRGAGNTTGIGLVEAYHLPNAPAAAPRH